MRSGFSDTMLKIKLITVGSLKEDYLRRAEAEYVKRLGGFCCFENVNLKEAKLPDAPSAGEIALALSKEAKDIESALSPRAYKIALCVEGKQYSSEKFAAVLLSASAEHSEIDFVIGSSHGLDESIKKMCDMRLSVSEMTFPHQLMRVLLLEVIYRSMNIIKGTKYHK